MFQLTLQNSMPRTELPDWSSGGDHKAIPITLGITSNRPPQTPDLAGRPTFFQKIEKKKQLNAKLVSIEN